MNFERGEQVRINSGEHYGKLATYVEPKGSMHYVRASFFRGAPLLVDSVIPAIANNGD